MIVQIDKKQLKLARTSERRALHPDDYTKYPDEELVEIEVVAEV